MTSPITRAEPRLLILDRDGTLLQPPRGRYVLGWEDVALRHDAAGTVAAAELHGFVPVLVTNQSCVGQRLTTHHWVEEVNAWIARRIAEAGGTLRHALWCPHVDRDGCACRKPKPGLLQHATQLTGLPLDTACMIGDSPVDLGAARAAGVQRFLHMCPEGGNAVCGEPDAQCLVSFADFLAKVT